MDELKATGTVLDRAEKDILSGFLNPGDILQSLQEQGALTNDDVQRIKNIADEVEQVHQLITIIKRKSKIQGYDVFMRVLQAKREDLHKLVKDIEADFPELRKDNSSKFDFHL